MRLLLLRGAVPGATNVSTSDGHSQDGTLEILRQFKAEEDPGNKLQIISKGGFWSEKDEMSQAYAVCATGDYLWQVDSDEFYRTQDIQSVLTMLHNDPSITAVSFKTLTFWGSPQYLTDGWSLKRGANIFHRLFKWGSNYQYITHRPPTVYDNLGRDTRSMNWINGDKLAKMGIYMYHYSLLLPKQVQEKSEYYSKTFAEISGGLNWAEENYMKLKHSFRVHNVYHYPSWLKRFQGEHPKQIQLMWDDLQSDQSTLALRSTDDIEELLNTKNYQIQRVFVQLLDYPVRGIVFCKRVFRRVGFLMRKMLPTAGVNK